jgi:hypothetical protein
MPKKPKYELIRCNHFAWRLSRRDGVWYADGRTNPVNVGRHSLGTRDKTEAMDLLARLDLSCAIKFGLIKPTVPAPTPNHKLSLSEGRRLPRPNHWRRQGFDQEEVSHGIRQVYRVRRQDRYWELGPS